MPALRQFTVVDPTERINVALKLSTRTCIEQYRLFYTASYGHGVERGELLEEVLRAFFDGDADFQKYVKKMTGAEKAAVDKALGGTRQNGGVSDTFIPDEA